MKIQSLALLIVTLNMTSQLSPASSELPAPASRQAVDSINQAGTALFQALPAEGNLLISPYSIQTALAMTYVGAAGDTRLQMAQALHFPEDANTLAEAFGALNTELMASAASAGQDFTLLVANRLFGQTGFAFRPAFLETLRGPFAAPLEELNYKENPAAATDKINQWVEKNTRQRIQNLIPEGALTRETTLVLVNALYAMMPWHDEFPVRADEKLDFALSSGAQPVPSMQTTASFNYAEQENFQLIGLPFRGRDFQFLILLPKPGQDPSWPASADAIWKIAAQMPSRQIRITLPKFRMEPPTIALKDVLVGQGMPEAFDIPPRSANFDAMAPRQPDDYLYISNVFHKTFLALDEKGVEAAAATAVVMMRALAMPIMEEPLEIKVDRPFFFAIQHRPTGTCLFLGRLTDPQ